MYTTHFPCIDCVKLLIKSGIKYIYYIFEDFEEEKNNYIKSLLEENNIYYE